MRKFLCFAIPIAALAVLVLAAVGVGVARSKMLDPVAVARDFLTGYQAASDRHRKAEQLPTPWDPISEANRLVESIPMAERSYPLFAEANAILEAAGVKDLLRRDPDHHSWSETVDWIESEAGRRVSALATEAVARPHAGFPIRDVPEPLWESARQRAGLEPESGVPMEHPSLVAANLPAVGAKRALARHLRAEALGAIAQRDPVRFENAALAIAGLTRHSYSPYFLIEHLVDRSIAGELAAVVRAAASDPQGLLTGPLATSLESALAQVAQSDRCKVAMEAETLFFEDQIRRMVDDNGVFLRDQADQVLWLMDSDPLDLRPSSVATDSINEGLGRAIDEHRITMQRATRAAEQPFVPYGDFEKQINQWKFEPDSIPGRHGKLMLGIFVPAVTKVPETTRTARQSLVATRLLLAAHRHRLRHGDPALALADIDPDLLTFQPTDGFTGGPLQYRWTDAGPLIYALGADGDDDGGRHALDADGEPLQTISDDYLTSKLDGDWRLYPPLTPVGESPD